MKITNFNLINIVKMLDSYAEKKLPQKISYAITRNFDIFKNNYGYYEKSLNKLFSKYDKYITKDDNSNIIFNDAGIPIIENSKSKEFNEELANLLNIEIEINPYYIPKNSFNYEDNKNRYDSLSALDIINLQSVLCCQNGSDANEISN